MADQTWLPQRWDVGLWDQALWDGQLGFNALQGTVTVTFGSANLVYTKCLAAQTSSIVVTGYPTGLLSGRSLKVDTGSIVVTPNPADVIFSVHHFLLCDQGMVLVNGPAAGQVTLTAFLQPGELNFGIPRVVVSGRW